MTMRFCAAVVLVCVAAAAVASAKEVVTSAAPRDKEAGKPNKHQVQKVAVESLGKPTPERPSPTKKPPDEKIRKAVVEMKLRLWPEKRIPFVFQPQINQDHRKEVKRVVKTLHKLTCVRFSDITGSVTNNDTKTPRVIVQSQGTGCWATLGYNNYKKVTYLNLPSWCFTPSRSGVTHELLHVLGVRHTHARFDRDDYVTVHTSRIIKGKEYNFDTRQDEYGKMTLCGVPYDYNSIQHYPTNAFSEGGKHETMTLKKSFAGEVGSATHISRADLATVNRMYDCTDYYLGNDIPGSQTYTDWKNEYGL